MNQDKIWGWVFQLDRELREAGREREADLIDQISDDVSELNIAKAEAIVPELISLSKSLNNPWLEVYTRHWNMRNRLSNKMEGEKALEEAVSLFEFAHRDEAINCPQSICVTQDLSSCYANVDGPGWVEERMAVCEETLERVDPSWNCYYCLSCEYADALSDDNRIDEAIRYLEHQRQKAIDAGEENLATMFDSFFVDLHLLNDQVDEAIPYMKRCEEEAEKYYDWPAVREDRRLSQALILAKQGQHEEAWNLLPSWGDLIPRYYRSWLSVVKEVIANNPTRNDWQLGRITLEMSEYFEGVGSYRVAFNVAIDHIKFALSRGSTWSAKRGLMIAKRLLSQLRKPAGADETLATLTESIANATKAVALPVEADQLLEWLNQRGEENQARNPEEEVEWLLLAAQTCDDEALISTTASALQACGADDEAIPLLWAYLDRHKEESTSLIYELLELLLAKHDYDQVETLIERYSVSIPDKALWCEVRLAYVQDDYERAKAKAMELYELDHEYLGALRYLVNIAEREKNFDDAIRWIKTLINQSEDPRNDQWDLLTYAASNQDWELAREMAVTLEIELDDESGPFSDDWGWARIRVYEEGEPFDYLARRYGPVTAIIEELAGSDQTQRAGDWITFDVGLLVEPPEDEEERKYFIPTYRLVHTITEGEFGEAWFIDGAYPGEAIFEEFTKALDELGWRYWIRSSQEYQLTDQYAEDLNQATMQGIYFQLAAPKTVQPAEIDRQLTILTRDWAHPLCWFYLANQAGVDEQKHRDIIERYDL